MITGHYVTTANSIVFPRRHQVCVAVSFNPAGSMRIDAWGIEFGGKRFRYKVEDTVLLKKIDSYLLFRCLYTELGLLKSINLVYFIKDHRWTTE